MFEEVISLQPSEEFRFGCEWGVAERPPPHFEQVRVDGVCKCVQVVAREREQLELVRRGRRLELEAECRARARGARRDETRRGQCALPTQHLVHIRERHGARAPAAVSEQTEEQTHR